MILFFYTQPPEGGCEVVFAPASTGKSFNTQPPEGGCRFKRFLNVNGQVSTHSRAEAAANGNRQLLPARKGFNTQPREGGCTLQMIMAVKVYLVSTHSRAKAAAYAYRQLNISGEEKYTESPDKNRYSHPHDANQYLCLGAMPDLFKQQIINVKPHQAISSVTGY